MEELELRHVVFSRQQSRALMEKARTNVADMLNVHLTPAEQVWSRQLYYMLSLSTSGEVQRRLENVPEGEGAEAWKVFSEHYEPKNSHEVCWNAQADSLV